MDVADLIGEMQVALRPVLRAPAGETVVLDPAARPRMRWTHERNEQP